MKAISDPRVKARLTFGTRSNLRWIMLKGLKLTSRLATPRRDLSVSTRSKYRTSWRWWTWAHTWKSQLWMLLVWASKREPKVSLLKEIMKHIIGRKTLSGSLPSLATTLRQHPGSLRASKSSSNQALIGSQISSLRVLSTQSWALKSSMKTTRYGKINLI